MWALTWCAAQRHEHIWFVGFMSESGQWRVIMLVGAGMHTAWPGQLSGLRTVWLLQECIDRGMPRGKEAVSLLRCRLE
jgi:hypothetical protein